jgi:hypothetical protein
VLKQPGMAATAVIVNEFGGRAARTFMGL